MTGILVLSAWALGVLNSHGRFFLSYVAPVAWNAVIIAALLVFGGRFEGRSLMVIAAWAALLGGALQFLVQLPGALSAERSLRFSPSTDDSGVRQVLANAGPAVLGRGAVQLGAWIDQFLASFLFTGALAAMGFAQTLYVLPFSLFGMAVAAAELPQFARDGVARLDAVRERIGAGLSRMVVLVVPSVVGYVLLGDIIVAALYEGGAFTADDTALVYLALAGYSLGLLPSTASRLYASAFYALNDTKTPARIALLRVAISGALGLVLMRMLEPVSVQAPFTFGSAPPESPDWRPLGVVGLAAASAVAAWFEWIQLRRRAFGRVGRIAEPHGRTVRLLAAAVIAAAPARGLDLALGGLHPLAQAILVLPVFGAAYFALAHLFGVPDVLGPLQRVFRRGRG
jgi:putative peptidoglycan lipid II flippase